MLYEHHVTTVQRCLFPCLQETGIVSEVGMGIIIFLPTSIMPISGPNLMAFGVDLKVDICFLL